MRVFCLSLLLVLLVANLSIAGMDHKQVLPGPYKTGEEVSQMCLMCHEKQFNDVMKTSHWKWMGPGKMIQGKETSKNEYGKANLFNNFCTVSMVEESIAFCSKCHIGYGWTKLEFDFKDKSKVDCLVCHSREGNYRKTIGGYVDTKLMEQGKMDLVKSAQSVGKPNRDNCGVCHFFGGGGDAVKHGDLDSSLSKPSRELDVHMGGMDFTCQNCHTTKEHKIAGGSTFLATHEGRVSCEDCHKGGMAPHTKSQVKNILDKHGKSLACQTCHIPAFARGQETKMTWDWSTVGKDQKDPSDKPMYQKHKGSFTWAKDVIPTYAWYNGKVERYLMGDKIKDMKQVTYLSKPVGDIKDKDSKIYPFKVHTGKQPADSQNKYLLPFQTYKGLWSHYDWDKAIQVGTKSRGLAYSGKYEFVSTAFYGSINHQVAPKENVLKCRDCHFGSNRFDWKALGYKEDPLKNGGRFSNNLVSENKDLKPSKKDKK
ncbi:MAG: tetrathionate reductase family octaheme c-type cytochrome [Thermodesulfovibrionales bacterium]|nr:tetrathionate reductase family octaheme c-type cytochrome [Thermodesulfovibrionales bacterium]